MNTPLPPSASRSLMVFAGYLLAAGLLLLIAPALLLAPVGLPVPQDVWIRIVGLLALALGSTDLLAARYQLPVLVRWSVWRRGLAAACMVALVAIGVAPAALLVFAAADAASAIWTAWVLVPQGASRRRLA